jgi:hypothetical protein
MQQCTVTALALLILCMCLSLETTLQMLYYTIEHEDISDLC